MINLLSFYPIFFYFHRLTGEITVRQRNGLRLDNIPTDMINLSVEVSDGESSDSAQVEINVKGKFFSKV